MCNGLVGVCCRECRFLPLAIIITLAIRITNDEACSNLWLVGVRAWGKCTFVVVVCPFSAGECARLRPLASGMCCWLLWLWCWPCRKQRTEVLYFPSRFPLSVLLAGCSLQRRETRDGLSFGGNPKPSKGARCACLHNPPPGHWLHKPWHTKYSEGGGMRADDGGICPRREAEDPRHALTLQTRLRKH